MTNMNKIIGFNFQPHDQLNHFICTECTPGATKREYDGGNPYYKPLLAGHSLVNCCMCNREYMIENILGENFYQFT